MTFGLAAWIDTRGVAVSDARSAIDSVLNQRNERLQVVVLGEVGTIAELSTDDGVESIALTPTEDAAKRLNSLLGATSAPWILWVAASATLRTGAIAVIEDAVREFDLDLVYGDSQLSDGTPVYRPSFSPVRLREQDYLGDVRGMRVEAIRSVGGFRAGLDGAHPLDLTLRIVKQADRVLRIPESLAISRAAQVPATAFSATAVSYALDRLGIDATVSAVRDGPLEVSYPIEGNPLVSILIPTRGGKAIVHGAERTLVVDAVRGIVDRSTYTNVEFVIIVDDDVPQRTVDELRSIAGDRLRLVRWSEPFNFSAKMNLGAQYAAGDYLLLLNDDVEVISPGWIESMLGLAKQSDVGLVGAHLFFEDGTVQHGGHRYADSWAGHIAFGWQPEEDDALWSMRVVREVSGVTAACALVPSDVFWEVGGLSMDYSGNYNDVDFSLKIRATGRTILWTPRARLFHFESKTRIATVSADEIATLREHWGTLLLSDPYWR